MAVAEHQSASNGCGDKADKPLAIFASHPAASVHGLHGMH
jgi:hypothetical protein